MTAKKKPREEIGLIVPEYIQDYLRKLRVFEAEADAIYTDKDGHLSEENKRLREALEKIRDFPETWVMGLTSEEGKLVKEIAKDALKGIDESKGER